MNKEKELEAKKSFKSGVVTIVGRPNVGKSTLINQVLGEKIAIVSKVPQTTRNQIRGIYNDERGQIIFIDTPGLHLGRDQLDKFMNRASLGAIQDVDCIIHLVDSNERIGQEEENVVNQLNRVDMPVIVGLNKIDLKGKYIPEYIALWERTKGKPITELADELILLPLSGEKGTNVEKLLEVLFEMLPEGPAFYPTDMVADIPQQLAISDIIREKLFHIMREEVPHSIAVVIEQMEPRKKQTLYMRAIILVERDTQKEMVIGKGGKILKDIGTLARQELEELLGQKVFLELYVKTEKKWREDPLLLEQMGYSFRDLE